MKAFGIGLSALNAHQVALSVHGNNLANASTPGYHRQVVNLAGRPPLRSDNFSIGSGVEISSVQRLKSVAIEKSLLRNSSEAGFSQQSLDVAKQVESLLTPQRHLDSFFPVGLLQSAGKSRQCAAGPDGASGVSLLGDGTDEWFP